MLKKQGFPEEGELVLCTVTNVQSHSVFVRVDEYDRNGLIHISEISPGRIRNIRDFVKEGKVIVCKVLRINKERGYIDLSLRRVTEAQRRKKADDIKAQQKAEKILEVVCTQQKKKFDEVFAIFKEKVMQDYDTLYDFFDACIKDESLMDSLGLDKKLTAAIMETIRQRIKPEIISIGGKFTLKSYKPDGIEIVKQAMHKAKEVNPESIKLQYLGAGKYQVDVHGTDYKVAEKILASVINAVTVVMEKAGSTAEFERKEE